MTLTKTAVLKAINALGLYAKSTGFDREIRVTYRQGDHRLVGTTAEQVAYYTDDPQDALNTAVMMTGKVL